MAVCELCLSLTAVATECLFVMSWVLLFVEPVGYQAGAVLHVQLPMPIGRSSKRWTKPRQPSSRHSLLCDLGQRGSMSELSCVQAADFEPSLQHCMLAGCSLHIQTDLAKHHCE